MVIDNGDVEAFIHFLSRDDIYKTVKPYTLRYKPPGSLPISNIVRQEERIYIRNMRCHLHSLKYDACGFQIANLDTKMTYHDFSDPNKIDKTHRPEIEDCVKHCLRASSVQVLDYVVRFFRPIFDLRQYIHAADPSASSFVPCRHRGAIRMAAAGFTSAHRYPAVPSIP